MVMVTVAPGLSTAPGARALGEHHVCGGLTVVVVTAAAGRVDEAGGVVVAFVVVVVASSLPHRVAGPRQAHRVQARAWPT